MFSKHAVSCLGRQCPTGCLAALAERSSAMWEVRQGSSRGSSNLPTRAPRRYIPRDKSAVMAHRVRQSEWERNSLVGARLIYNIAWPMASLTSCWLSGCCKNESLQFELHDVTPPQLTQFPLASPLWITHTDEFTRHPLPEPLLCQDFSQDGPYPKTCGPCTTRTKCEGERDGPYGLHICGCCSVTLS